ncbi:Bardet-Biedl syndrome 4 protein homolog [Condylostylus longicornis]|uniref:Bardet-Biedl syndrome 4 protein homolog n=1 Tax=Condylostylus longicornis TaxID=2530218 RepID=UPI00244E2D9F|nr:Bardet-Biedl syndrome 4 protein homolog [Condylostylus longicornis]
MADPYCNGKTPNLPSLEVVKKVEKPFVQTENLNWLLHIYYARQDFDMCRVLIERQLVENINADYLYFVRGLIERKEGDLFAAIKSFQKAIDLNSNNLDTYKEIGKTLYSMGRFKQSMGVFREAERMSTQLRRPDPEICHYIAEILQWNIQQKFESGKKLSSLDSNNSNLMNEVKEYYQKAIQIGKKFESYKRLAEIYRNEREYNKAIEILENCLQIVPENQEILTEIGVLYLKVNDPQRAFDKLIEVTSINDKFSKGLLAFGAILQSRNDIGGALAKYTKISGEEYECAELWNNIGLCFFKKNKLIVAISCLRKSVWISPTNYNALYNLSLIFITARQYASAFHTLAAALSLRKDSAESYMLLAICLRKLEDYENAFTAFERAATLPDGMKNPLILLNFSAFCYETERIELAIKYFNDFVDVAQDFVLPTEYKFQATKLKALLQQQEEFEGNPNVTTSDDIEKNKSSNDLESHKQTLNNENVEIHCYNDQQEDDENKNNDNKNDNNENDGNCSGTGGDVIKKNFIL